MHAILQTIVRSTRDYIDLFNINYYASRAIGNILSSEGRLCICEILYMGLAK